MEIKITFSGAKKVDAHFDGFVVKTDQPSVSGGDGTAPSPFQIFLSSLGTCAGIYVKSFCDSRGIDTAGIEIIQKIHYNQEARRIGKVTIDIQLPAHFPEKYREAVVNTANLCAVKQYLQQPFDIETFFSIK